jgi:translation initiation factor IF-2
MSKIRVYEVAKQLNLEPKALVVLFQNIGIVDVRNHMSSVDVDAVERIKRHLDKQKTHDVVEERVRPTVIKRRAVVKPADAPAAQPSAPSMRDVAAMSSDVASTRSLASFDEVKAPPAMPSAPRMPAPKESAPRIAPERVSVKHVEPSVRALEVPPAAPSVREVVAAAAPMDAVEAIVPPRATLDLSPVHEIAAETYADEPVVAPAETFAQHIEPVEAVQPSRSTPPKTGVEYWTGRPGVPMPMPVNAVRTGIGGGSIGSMPRRVQYDPRAGSSAPGARPGARPMTPGLRPGQQSRGPMGGGGMRPGGGRFGMQMPRRPTVNTAQEMGAHKKVIRIEENITLSAMAMKMSLKATELLMKLLSMGMTNIHINTTLDADTAKILANEFGWEVEDVAVSEEEHIAAAQGIEVEVATGTGTVEKTGDVRSPVVTVMGHVDHGKTSLLDRIRKANVASGEAGGITQHIGAYKVTTANGTIVFLDTPGHEAFTAMRARGASVTDVVVLVVAADDGVMPQTKEAVAHAKAAKVPIIVAVNKCDKPGAEPERVRRELVELGLQPEEWGGDTIFLNVSAKTGDGVSQLLEMIALQAEVLDLRANPNKVATGTVLEALLDRGRGAVARILVQDGTLRVGDFVLAGPGFGKVRAMVNEHGKQVQEAGPATPVEILGLSDVPNAGDDLHAVKDPKKAQEIADARKQKAAGKGKADIKVSLEELSKRIQTEGQQELRIIVKGDVQGSVEAVSDTLKKLTCEKVRLSVIHAAVGAITEGDVNLAIAGKAVIIGFNVRPAGKAGALADENKIEIRIYSIIYQAIDDVKSAMEGLLPPHMIEKVHGKAELRQLFTIKNVAVAGSYVTEGIVRRNALIRVVRDGIMVHEGKLGQLKRFKDDVKDVAEGFECGISLENFNDIKEGDILECYEMEAIKQRL